MFRDLVFTLNVCNSGRMKFLVVFGLVCSLMPSAFARPCLVNVIGNGSPESDALVHLTNKALAEIGCAEAPDQTAGYKILVYYGFTLSRSRQSQTVKLDLISPNVKASESFSESSSPMLATNSDAMMARAHQYLMGFVNRIKINEN